MEEERQKEQQQQQQSGGWTSWLWGSSSTSKSSSEASDGTMTEQQRKELYDVLDYDEKTALAESFERGREAMQMRVLAKLKRGSFALKNNPHQQANDLLSLVFDAFQAGLTQRPNNFEGSLSLGDFRVFDGTTSDSIYRQIVRVKEGEKADDNVGGSPGVKDSDSQVVPFFSLKFEHNPLDERADNGLTVYLRSMEVIYQKGYIEAVYNFFKPPESQLQSLEALLVRLFCRLLRSKLITAAHSERSWRDSGRTPEGNKSRVGICFTDT